MSLKFITAGESHGPSLMAIIEGLPAGIKISIDEINSDLSRRQKGFGSGPRMKIEKDTVEIFSGVMEGLTIGSPVAFRIENKDHQKWQGRMVEPFPIPRPGHADLTGVIKYGYSDLRPALERASARETAARVAVGSLCKQFLSIFNIDIFGYVLAIGDIESDIDSIKLEDRKSIAENNELRCPDLNVIEAMRNKINDVIMDKNTLGGILEVVAINVPPGLGSYAHWDRRIESRLGAALLSIQAIKGVEIGYAFDNTRKPGTQVNDSIYIEKNILTRKSNHSGGIEGGITNGNPILLRAAMKPIATTLTPLDSVDLSTGKQVVTKYERSDFCPVPRAVPILEAMVAFVISDALIEKIGGDSIQEMLPRFKTLSTLSVDKLKLDGLGHVFWPGTENV